ncbi:MAG: LPS export ABC transporter permease LptG [Nitrospirales bacterium]|nr:MAG: LPS export ABC transporter permease LptG [Nitrospirales bacterium]
MSIPTLHRYLWGSAIRGYLPVIAILLAVFSLFVFVEEVEEVGNGRYTFWAAGEFVLLTLPERFVVLSPFIALLGSIMALGGLANGRELLAMQAGGISHYQIAWAVMQVGILFMVTVVCLEEYVTPTLDQYAHISRSLALSDSHVYQGKQGLWFREGNRYIRIKTLKYGEIPQEIDIFEFNPNGEMIAYLYAEEADVQNPQKWVLKNIQKKIIDGHRVSEVALPSLMWDSPFNREEMRLLTLPASSLAPSDLFRYIEILQRKNQNVLRYELAFWEKIFMPLKTGLMILVALPFAFGPLRSASAGKRIMLGGLVGIGYYLTTEILENLGILLGASAFLTTIIPFLGIVLATAIIWWVYFS